jgi:hypothetical protein
MKNKLYRGGRKAIVEKKQQEARTGRENNQSIKDNFKTGGVSGSQRTDVNHRAAVVRGKKAASDGE